MSVQDILKTKGAKVVTVEPTALVSVAARRLRLEHIGALVVSSDGSSIEGIISERDIVYGLIDHGAEVLDKPVSELMTRHPFTCSPQAGVKEAMRLMALCVSMPVAASCTARATAVTEAGIQRLARNSMVL